MKKILNVLIACEESQAECKAFRDLGHNAYSCDLQMPIKGGHIEWHIIGDVRPLLHGKPIFRTMDLKLHKLPRWDLIIAHPPCTYLSKVSSVQLIKNGKIDPERYQKMIEAKKFFMECLGADAPYVAVENPLPMRRAGLPRPSCYADPSWFGERYTKKTLYWLKNLPPLMAEINHANPVEFVKRSRGKYRSRTFPAMARAIARQWSEFILSQPR